jgi:MIP family channel proteins
MNRQPTLFAELLAEFLGTFVLILFGSGVVAMVVLFPSTNPGEVIHGGYTNITLGWGLAVTMGIYISGKLSGGHLNPAVTLTFAVFRGFPWSKVMPYCIAQTAGAFLAAALVYKNYLPAFQQFDPGLGKTAGVFTTFPAFPALLQAGFLDQVIGTALLLLMVFAITDELNVPPGANLAPLMVGVGGGGDRHELRWDAWLRYQSRARFRSAPLHSCGRIQKQWPLRWPARLVGASDRAVAGRADWGRCVRFRRSPFFAHVASPSAGLTLLEEGGTGALHSRSRSGYDQLSRSLVR